MTHVTDVVCITPALLGSPDGRNIVVDDQRTYLADDVPQDAWVLDVEPDVHPGRDLNTLMRLAGVDVNLVSDEDRKMMRTLGVDPDSAPWVHILPAWKLRKCVHEAVGDVVRVLNGPDRGYYLDVYEPSRRLLGSLGPCCIDEDLRRSYIAAGEGNVPSLKSFAPDIHGLCAPPMYDILTGRTGRMKVTAGPQVLTLAKTHRDIITSRWDGGRVLSFDYASLEARIAALEGGHDPPEDVYADLAEGILGGVPRKVAKLAVLSTLFGAGRSMLEDHVEPGAAGWLIDRIRSHFGVHDVVKRLHVEHASSGGFIRSRLGRNVRSREAGHILYNSYIQSTGVDVALSGFRRMVDEMHRRQLASVPIFVLHDAFLIDFHPDELDHVENIRDAGCTVEGYDVMFPIHVEQF